MFLILEEEVNFGGGRTLKIASLIGWAAFVFYKHYFSFVFFSAVISVSVRLYQFLEL